MPNPRPNLGEFEHLVLATALRLKGQGYGATLVRELEERTGRQVLGGALYATLKGVAAPGLAAESDEWTISRENGRVLAFNETSGVLGRVTSFAGVLAALADRLLSPALKAG